MTWYGQVRSGTLDSKCQSSDPRDLDSSGSWPGSVEAILTPSLLVGTDALPQSSSTTMAWYCPRHSVPPPEAAFGLSSSPILQLRDCYQVPSVTFCVFSFVHILLFTQHPDFPSPKILPISSAAVCPSCTSFFSRLWANPSLVVDLPPILASGPFQILLAVLIAVFDPDYCIFG